MPLIVRSFILFLLVFHPNLEVQATHIVGGELNYRSVGNDMYEVSLTVYRDCYNGQAAFDNPAAIGVFDDRGNLITMISAYINSQSQVANVVNSPCLVPPTNVCYEVANYRAPVNLPPITGGYYLVYQRCCRNSTIVNLRNVSSTGGSYVATIPDVRLTGDNGNPVFNSLPPTFICMGAPFRFDHSATDPEGDSLVYEVCTPYSGGNQQNPAPNPPDPPPYLNVVFQSPYNIGNMLGGTPLSIDAVSGEMTATPNMSGQFVYGIRVKEYRNGMYIGDSRRDFQINVVPCPTITVASIFSPTIVCGSLQADFLNNSFGAATYDWDFGDPLTNGDTSTLEEPSYLYPDTGIYQVRLIAYSSIDPDCNDTAFGEVRVYPPFLTAFDKVNTRCSPEYRFLDRSYGVNGAASYWQWNFGDSAVSSLRNPVHTYNNSGSYEVIFVASTDSGCTDTASMIVHVLKVPVADFNAEIDTCRLSVSLDNRTTSGILYDWDFGSIASSGEVSPRFVFPNSGVYPITLTATSDSGCSVSLTRSIVLPELPSADFSWQVAACDSNVQFTNNSDFSSSYYWDFGDGDKSFDSSPQHLYQLAGYIPVELIAYSPYGCADTVSKSIFFVSYKEAGFNFYVDSCAGNLQFTDVSSNAVSYLWDFGDGSVSREKLPVHTYKNDGEYRVSLTLNGEYACVDSISELVRFETPKGERVYLPSAFTPNGDGLNDLFKASVYLPCDIYSLYIFNRWGQVVYQIDDVSDASWDGTFNGSQIPEGVYVFLLEGRESVRRGVISVLR